MKQTFKLLALALFLAVAVILVPSASLASPALAGANNCSVDPGTTAPLGTIFAITCWGFTPGVTVNIYAVEPDGRASTVPPKNLFPSYFPSSAKVDGNGSASFLFTTTFAGILSAPPGDYIFVVQQLAPGHAIAVEDHVTIHVTGAGEILSGATLQVVGSSQPNETTDIRTFLGTGFAPFEVVNIWVTLPPATHCSGFNLYQLSQGTLSGESTDYWDGPGAVKADAGGNITFSINFRESNCNGTFFVTARALDSGRGADVALVFIGNFVTATGAVVTVSPSNVLAYGAVLTVSGSGFPANTGINCWFTRPDGRVIYYLNQTTKTDGGGSFAVAAYLDDFVGYTSTEPGRWWVTCATTDRSALGIGTFLVSGLPSDP